jgi:hypothetical protein
VPVKVIEDD